MRKWVNGGGKLKVGGDVLVGLSRWETLVPKTKEVDQLLKNMPEVRMDTTGRAVGAKKKNHGEYLKDMYIYIYYRDDVEM